MGHVQDTHVSTSIISNVCMICHMKVHIVSCNLDQKKFSKSKIHILPDDQTNLRTAIVIQQCILMVTLNAVVINSSTVLIKKIIVMKNLNLHGQKKAKIREWYVKKTGVLYNPTDLKRLLTNRNFVLLTKNFKFKYQWVNRGHSG